MSSESGQDSRTRLPSSLPTSFVSSGTLGEGRGRTRPTRCPTDRKSEGERAEESVEGLVLGTAPTSVWGSVDTPRTSLSGYGGWERDRTEFQRRRFKKEGTRTSYRVKSWANKSGCEPW